MDNLLITKLEDGVLHLIINRPDQKNCLNRELVDLLTKKLLNAKNVSETRVIYLYGAGDEAFSSGADLKEISNFKEDTEIEAFFQSFGRLIETISSSKKPIITKIHGFALAGAIGLVAASHISIASDVAVFGLPEIQKGLAPMVVMAPLARCIHRKSLAYLSLTAEQISSEEAKTIGLISLVVEKSKLDEVALELAKKIANRENTAIQSIIEGINITSGINYKTSLKVLSDKIACLAKIQFTSK